VLNLLKIDGVMRLLAAVLGVLILSACAPTNVSTSYENLSRPLPRPDVIVLVPFAVSPDEVSLDRGVSAEIQQAMQGQPRTAQERAIGRQVADAIASKLAGDLQSLGFPVVIGQNAPPGSRSPLLVTGELVSIDEGNRTERMIIGLGAGRSDVRVAVQVYEQGVAGTIDAFEVDAKSGYKPGMAESMGFGAATGNLVAATMISGTLGIASEAMSANVVADADRAAGGITRQLAGYFGQQGWLP
jgi:hypothetical protein